MELTDRELERVSAGGGKGSARVASRPGGGQRGARPVALPADDGGGCVGMASAARGRASAADGGCGGGDQGGEVRRRASEEC